jgi:hypothetical protein
MLMMATLLKKKGYANAGHSPQQKVMLMLAILHNRRLCYCWPFFTTKGFANADNSPEQRVMLMLVILQNKRL